MDSEAATCPVAPDPTFQIVRAPASPRVPWLRTPPPYKGGLQCAACSTALDPASLQGEGSGAPRVLRLRILPPYLEGSGAATACPTVFCGPRVINIKKSLAGMPVQQCPPIFNARAHIYKAPGVRAIMGLQDVRAGTTVNACMTCEQAPQSMSARRVDRRLQCCYSTTPALLTTRLALLQCRHPDSTAPRY
jgi:hypothetical protein